MSVKNMTDDEKKLHAAGKCIGCASQMERNSRGRYPVECAVCWKQRQPAGSNAGKHHPNQAGGARGGLEFRKALGYSSAAVGGPEFDPSEQTDTDGSKRRGDR